MSQKQMQKSPNILFSKRRVSKFVPTSIVKKIEVDSGIEYRKRTSNELHNDEGPAKIYLDKKGNVTQEAWLQNGTLHRSSGPAIIKYTIKANNESVVSQEGWYLHGQVRRKEGPALVLYYLDGSLKEEYWFRKAEWSEEEKAELNRTDGPAVIQYHRSNNLGGKGQVSSEQWFANNKFHRENGPAVIEYDIQGRRIKNEYWQENARHCKNGPAVVHLQEKNKNEYWVRGKKISKDEFERRFQEIQAV